MKRERLEGMGSRVLMVLLSLLLSLVVGSVFILIAGRDPIDAYRQLLIVPFSSKTNIGELLTNLTPLLIAGAGMAVARCAGLTNLGGEGQIYMGAMGLIIVCTSGLKDVLGVYVIIPGILSAMLMGGMWGGISGVLRSYFNANEIITSLLLNYVAVNLVGFAVRGPLQEPTGVAPESEKLLDILRLPKLIPASRAHTGIFIAIVVLLLYYIFIYRTRVGYNIRVLGGSPKAALYSGINPKKYYLSVMALSGAVAGLVGCVEVMGVYYKLTEKLAGSIGFTGVVIALLGMKHPVGIFFAALLMALLNTGGQYIQVSSNIPASLVDILQGLIVLFVLFGLSLNLAGKLRKKKEG